MATFEANGDVLTVCDTDADGYRIAVYVEASFQPHYWKEKYRTYDAGADGVCVKRGTANGGNYDLAEGTDVRVWVCRGTEWLGNDSCRTMIFTNTNH